jgi:hypothetical protein
MAQTVSPQCSPRDQGVSPHRRNSPGLQGDFSCMSRLKVMLSKQQVNETIRNFNSDLDEIGIPYI